MRLTKTYAAMPVALAAALTLGACGSVDNEAMYAEFEKTCKTSFVDEGGPAEMAAPFCECSTQKVREQELGPLELMDQQKMTEVAEACAGELMPN